MQILSERCVVNKIYERIEYSSCFRLRVPTSYLHNHLH